MTQKLTIRQRYPALFYSDFRLLWGGQFVSNIGSQMQIVALTWHIYALIRSPLSLGLIGLSRFLPLACFSLLGGVVADAKNRKQILFVTQTSLLLFSTALAITTFRHTVTPLLIYSMTVLSGVALAFDAPARQALMPTLVKRHHLRNALSLNIILFQTAMILGPAIGGLLIGKSGVGVIYALNACSFLAVIASLFLMRSKGTISGKPSPVSVQAIREGLSFVRHHTIIWSTTLLDFLATFLASATTLMPIFALKILHVSAFEAGFLYSAQAIGSVSAAFFMAHIGQMKHEGRVLLAAVGVFAVATVIFGFSKWYVVSFFALVLSGASDGISTVIRNTIRNLSAPDEMRGRMNSVMMIFFMGGPQLGEFEAGILAALVGAPLSVALGGIGTLIAVGAMAVFVPRLREYKGTSLEQISP